MSKKINYFILLIFVISCQKKISEVNSDSVKKVIIEKKDVEKKRKEKELSCSLLPTISGSTKVNVSLREITDKEYIHRKNEDKIEKYYNSDSIENILILKYPKIFLKKDNKLTITSKNLKRSFLNNKVQDKTYSKYTITGKFKNYIIISEEFYEGWNHVVVDINNNQFYILPNEPIFINENLFYAFSNYYGDEDLTIIDVFNEQNTSFVFSNIQFNKSYYISNQIRFEVECLNSRKKKYLEILID